MNNNNHNRMGYIYLITNTINNKKYVGQTIQEDVTDRWRAYKTKCQSSLGRYIYNAMCKYPIEVFKFEVVCICFNEDCNDYEKYYIKKFKTLAPIGEHGYNLHEGGKNVTIGKKRILTDEQRRGLFGRSKGIYIKSMLEKHCSEERKKKISEKHKNKTVNITWDTHKSYIVEKYDKNNNLLESFESLKSAAKTINTCGAIIKNHANTGILYYGFYWKVSEVDNKDKFNLMKKVESMKKKVAKLDENGEIICIFDSISAATRSMNSKSIPGLSRCVSEDPKYSNYTTFKGFKWKLV
jgi:group I intron endonuclease